MKNVRMHAGALMIAVGVPERKQRLIVEVQPKAKRRPHFAQWGRSYKIFPRELDPTLSVGDRFTIYYQLQITSLTVLYFSFDSKSGNFTAKSFAASSGNHRRQRTALIAEFNPTNLVTYSLFFLLCQGCLLLPRLSPAALPQKAKSRRAFIGSSEAGESANKMHDKTPTPHNSTSYPKLDIPFWLVLRLLSTEPKCNTPNRYGLEMLKRSKIRLVSGTRPESLFSHIYSAKLFKRCPQKAPVHLATRICYVNLLHQYRSVADLVPTSISSISIVIAILTVAILR
ncbi:hypothetical protein DFH05DRAFT_232855 [Lentinula detonsa]|uniref:Uncharacterized protein n=1 Tax=Lentinula detonsa TaxID=2804962 RepID=A0A9W8TWG7_9AGAR|nr:hypothetical protein DFH05DRAFT_232855 [Lentinula detonsa]